MVQSPRRLAEHRTVLGEFNNAYVEYLKAEPGHQNAVQLRSRVLELLPAAQEALNEAEQGLIVSPPPGFPGIYDGLSNTVFLHEQSGVYADVPQHVRDVLRHGPSQLERREGELARKRRNPLYWGDRIVSAVLRFPAYSSRRFSAFQQPGLIAQRGARSSGLPSFAAAVLGVYFGGSAAGWW